MQGLAFALEFDGRLGKALNIWEIFMVPAMLQLYIPQQLSLLGF